MQRIFIISVVAAIALFASAVALVLHDNPKAQARTIRKCFDQIPSARVTFISDLAKQASQEVTAYIEVDGKGEIGFTRLNKGSFGHTSHIYLHGIGPYRFRTRQLMKGQAGYGYTIDIGSGSPVPAARQLGITSVQSAVSHYDDLLAVIAHWPVTTNEWPKRWPAKSGEWSNTSGEEIHFPDLPRGDYYFCLKR